MTCLPKRLRAFVGTNGTTNRRAYACAVLTTLRDEIKRGNVWIRGSTRFGKLDDFFLPDAAWAIRRQDFFRKAGLPADSVAVAPWLTRLNAAYDRFLAAPRIRRSPSTERHLATDPAEALSPADGQGWPPCESARDKILPFSCQSSSSPWIMISTGPATFCPAGSAAHADGVPSDCDHHGLGL
jgi:hypothetical protein